MIATFCNKGAMSNGNTDGLSFLKSLVSIAIEDVGVSDNAILRVLQLIRMMLVSGTTCITFWLCYSFARQCCRDFSYIAPHLEGFLWYILVFVFRNYHQDSFGNEHS